jgi:Pyruvate/2-oxoacid:ferredoxin oxidoreductase delta subunit
MQEQIYKKLAVRLDSLPNAFPATDSGVELKLLAKIFTPEEASLASVMRMTHETAAEIGARAGLDAESAYELLKAMRKRGLIYVKKHEGELVFAIEPFAVGFYEEQLPYIDEEMAQLVESYFQESQGGFLQAEPSVHRVIPVGEAIPVELEVFPFEQATEMLNKSKSWAVRDCICRVQQKLAGKGCDHSVNNCLVFAPIEGAFDRSEVNRALSKEEAFEILQQTEEEGLVHSTGNYSSGNMYICNCCNCCCGILRGISEFSIPTAAAHSNFYAVVDEELCIGCLDCEERCQFEAISIPDQLAVIDYSRCMGCGSCALVCTVDALYLERRPEEDMVMVPATSGEWEDQRMKSRGLPSSKVL